MAALAWVMMGLAIWHFAIFIPDRFWGGIVGSLLCAVVGAVTRDGAVRLHQRGEEIGRGDRLGPHRFGQGVAHGTFHDLGPGEELEEEAMVVRRMLAEAAVRADEFGALFGEQVPPEIIGPMREAAEARPESGRGLESDQLRDAVIVLLSQGVTQMVSDAVSGRVGEPCCEGQAGVRRRRMIAEGLQGERDGDQAEGRLLSAHPVRAAVRWITPHPVLERGPKEFDVAIFAIPKPGAHQSIGPREAREFPDAFDVISPGIGNARPMAAWI